MNYKQRDCAVICASIYADAARILSVGTSAHDGLVVAVETMLRVFVDDIIGPDEVESAAELLARAALARAKGESDE